jgi:hypothetical protein
MADIIQTATAQIIQKAEVIHYSAAPSSVHDPWRMIRCEPKVRAAGAIPPFADADPSFGSCQNKPS